MVPAPHRTHSEVSAPSVCDECQETDASHGRSLAPPHRSNKETHTTNTERRPYRSPQSQRPSRWPAVSGGEAAPAPPQTSAGRPAPRLLLSLMRAAVAGHRVIEDLFWLLQTNGESRWNADRKMPFAHSVKIDQADHGETPAESLPAAVGGSTEPRRCRPPAGPSATSTQQREARRQPAVTRACPMVRHYYGAERAPPPPPRERPCARSAATGCPRLAPGSVVRGRGPARCCRRVRGIAVQSLQCEPGGTRACVALHRWQVAARSERRPSASQRRALGMSWWGCRWACAWSISCSACSLSHQLVERFPTPSLSAARH